MIYKSRKSSRKKRRRVPVKKKQQAYAASFQEEEILPSKVHDVYADLMDVFYEETNGTSYQQPMRFDDASNSFVIGTFFHGNVYYKIKQEDQPDVATYTELSKRRPGRVQQPIIKSIPHSIINENIKALKSTIKPKYQPYNSSTTMAKTNTNGETLKFRGIPITGDAQSFVKLIESKFDFQNWDFKETTVELYGGQFVGEDVQLTIYYSQKSKTVYAINVYFTSLTYEDEYKHYKSLYTQKYGKPSIIKNDYENEKAVFETENGRIMLYGNFSILYTNTVNEKLAIKEHDLALLDEI